MVKVAIVGAGIVGNNLFQELKKLSPVLIDKYKKRYEKPDVNKHYDAAFICVPSPLKEDESSLDTSEVENALSCTNADLIIVKSTVNPGCVGEWSEKYCKNIIFSPEYYGGTQHCNNFQFNFTVLGGKDDLCHKAQNILQSCYDATHRFIFMTDKEAETLKLMENSWLATKVSFCCEFYDYCRREGLEYDRIREGFIADPRVSASHTFVYDDKPYWDSHCLNKDVPACSNIIDSQLLKKICEINRDRVLTM